MRLIICPKTGLFRAFLYLKPPKRRLKLIFSLYLFSKKKIKMSSERGKIEREKQFREKSGNQSPSATDDRKFVSGNQSHNQSNNR